MTQLDSTEAHMYCTHCECTFTSYIIFFFNIKLSNEVKIVVCFKAVKYGTYNSLTQN